MDPALLNDLTRLLLTAALPGAMGGLAWFLYALKRGHYRNDKYAIKATIEIVGAMCVASAVSQLVTTVIGHRIAPFVASFAIGVCWSELIQVFRDWITRVVRAILGGPDST